MLLRFSSSPLSLFNHPKVFYDRRVALQSVFRYYKLLNFIDFILSYSHPAMI